MTWTKPKFEVVDLCSEVTSYLLPAVGSRRTGSRGLARARASLGDRRLAVCASMDAPQPAVRPALSGRVRRPSARTGNALPQPASVPRADEQRRAHERGASDLGGQPLHVPDHHSAEGRGDPDELPRPRGAARVDLAHLRPRRRRRRTVAGSTPGSCSARRSASPRHDGERAARAPCRPVRLRGLPQLLPPEAVDRGSCVVAHRAFRPGRDQDAARRDGEALSVDRPRRPRLLPRLACMRRATRSTRSTSPSSTAALEAQQTRSPRSSFKLDMLWVQLDAIDQGDTRPEGART